MPDGYLITIAMLAGSVLVTLPVLTGFIFVQRFLIQGLAVGAVK